VEGVSSGARHEGDRTLQVPCFGGFAVTLAYGISRLTFDIDVLDIAPLYAAEILMREGGKALPSQSNTRSILILSASPIPPMNTNHGSVPCMKGHFSICTG
jgi:hypothetical protein